MHAVLSPFIGVVNNSVVHVPLKPYFVLVPLPDQTSAQTIAVDQPSLGGGANLQPSSSATC